MTNTRFFPHPIIYLASSFWDSRFASTTVLNIDHFLGPFNDCGYQLFHLGFSVVRMESQSDPALAFGNSRVFHWESTKSPDVQMKHKPVAISLAGPNRNNVCYKRFILPL